MRCALILMAVVLSGLCPLRLVHAQDPVATPDQRTPSPLVELLTEIDLGDDPWYGPSGLAFASDGTLYVAAAQDDQIRVFDREGQLVARWGERGTGPGQFRFAEQEFFSFGWGDLAFGPDGNLYVMDTFNSRIQVFAPDGTYLREWGTPGAGDGQFLGMRGIGLDSEGRIYVADYDRPYYGRGRIQIFASDGRHLATWEPNVNDLSTRLSPEDVAIDAQGIASVTDAANERVMRFDAAGNLIGTWAYPAESQGVAIDAAGNLYVADWSTNQVRILAPDGSLRGVITRTGHVANDRRFPNPQWGPEYLTVSPSGLLSVSAPGRGTITVFRLLPPLTAP